MSEILNFITGLLEALAKFFNKIFKKKKCKKDDANNEPEKEPEQDDDILESTEISEQEYKKITKKKIKK